MTEPARLFLVTSGVFAAAVRGYWVVLAVRIVDDLRYDPLQLTLLGTALELSILVAEVPTGAVADLVSRRLSVIISFLVMGPALMVSGVAEAFWVVALTQVAWGVGYTFQSGADVAWLTDELDDTTRVDALLLRRATVQIAATIVGVGAAAGTAALTSRTTAVVAAGAVLITWGVVLAVVMPEHGFRPAGRATAREFGRVVRLGGRVALGTRSVRILVIAVVLGGIAAEAIDRLDTARILEVGVPDGLDEVVLVAGLSIVQAIVGILLVREIERRSDRLPAATALGLLFGATAVSIAVVAGVGVLGVVLVALVGKEAFLVAGDPLITTIANSHDESAARATVLSFVGQANALGEITGGIALGALARATSLSTAFVVSAALFAVAGLVVGRAR